MRVVLVTHAFPPDQIAGVERYTDGLAGALARAGDEVTVVAGARSPGRSCSLERDVRPDGVTVYWLKRPQIPPSRFLQHSAAMERLFDDMLDESPPDLVHINHLFELSPRFVAAAHRRAAVVISLWDYYFACARIQLRKRTGEVCAGPRGGRECASTCFAREQRAELRWRARTEYFRRVLASADRILSPSRYAAEYFASHVPAPARIRVLPLGLAADVRSVPSPPPADVLRLSVLGQLHPAKGADLVVAALRLAKLPGSRLVLEGRVVDERYAQRLADQARAVTGLDLRFGGDYSLDELPERLAEADLVVVPSRFPETFGFVVREALAAGRPVLAARIGALPEGVDEGTNGFTFAPEDAEELASLLRLLDEDRGLLVRLTEGARARRPLAMEAHADAARRLYRDTIRARRSGHRPPGIDNTGLRRLEARLVELGFGGS